MISYDGEVTILDKEQTKGFFEAVWVHKYKGKYYLSYAGKNADGRDEIMYAIADKILGPYEFKGSILPAMNSGTNHHSIVQYDGNWYLFYHNSDLFFENHPEKKKKFGWGHEGSPHPYRRSICAERLFYNENGTIGKVSPSSKGISIPSN